MGEIPSLRVPGDKSITHRLLLLAGLAPGVSRIRGALTSLDARSTARILRVLGVRVSPLRPEAQVRVVGRGRFRRPKSPLDCGNSGTTARLVMGLLAAHSFRAVLTGDASLRRRPMRRVSEPLERMGARFEGRNADRLPIAIRGGPLRELSWELPVSSAQIKGALLLAGLAGARAVSLREPAGLSRDHTERLLRAFGFTVRSGDDGWVHFEPDGRLESFDLTVPGDPSSAAFLVGAALLSETPLRIEGVGINPTRTGFLRVLERMGAVVEVEDARDEGGEPVGNLLVTPASLTAVTVEAGEIPSLIDEIPMLAVLASRARGVSRFHDVGELRVKESNRLALLAENLRGLGADARVDGDALEIDGGSPPPRGRVRTEGDHRIAMAFAVLGLAPGARVAIDDLGCAAVSFPGFDRVLQRLRRRRSA
ncbi:MAG: 3-phosphoshikimate 1-carboxyvinyltransferase [Gemmatimonadales bacterium]